MRQPAPIQVEALAHISSSSNGLTTNGIVLMNGVKIVQACGTSSRLINDTCLQNGL